MNEFGLTTLLAKKFAAPEYAFIPQVRNCTGFAKRIRTADGIAMSLYPSRGLHLTGFEIKTDRADWKRELTDPAKADDIATHCHFWYVVTSADSIAPVAEVPVNWGLIVADKTGLKLRTVKVATHMEATPPGFPFLAGILRKAQEVIVPKASIEKEIELARVNERKRQSDEWELRLNRVQSNLSELEERVREFEKRSGLNLRAYRGPSLYTNAEVIEAMRNGPGRTKANELRSLISHIELVLNTARCQERRMIDGQPEPDWSI